MLISVFLLFLDKMTSPVILSALLSKAEVVDEDMQIVAPPKTNATGSNLATTHSSSSSGVVQSDDTRLR